MEGNLPFLPCFTLYLRARNFRVQAPRRSYIWRGDLTEGFLREGVVKKRESPDFRSPEVGDVF